MFFYSLFGFGAVSDVLSDTGTALKQMSLIRLRLCCENQGDLRQAFATCETIHLARVACGVDAVVETSVLLGQAAVLPACEAVGQLPNRLFRAARRRRGSLPGWHLWCRGVAACLEGVFKWDFSELSSRHETKKN